MLSRTVVLRIGLAVAMLTACANQVVAYGGDGGPEGGRFQGFRSSRSAGERHDPRTCPECRSQGRGGSERGGSGRGEMERGGSQGGERFTRGPRGMRREGGGGVPDCAECAAAGKRGGSERGGSERGAWSSPSARSRGASRGGSERSWSAERGSLRADRGGDDRPARGSWRSARTSSRERGGEDMDRMAMEGDRY